MRIVVIGGTGLIGSRTINVLRQAGHEAIAAAPSTGVNTVTGEGLDAALVNADVVVDLANSPSFEPPAVLNFFTTHEANLVAAELRARVKHHVVLSIVGTDRLQGNAYFQAKVAQENVVKRSGVPYTVIRSTQFMEFIGTIAESGDRDGVVHVAAGLFQPIAADDVAAIVAETAQSKPRYATIEIAGPERAPFDEFIRRYLATSNDRRSVCADPDWPYFCSRLDRLSLVPLGDARLGRLDFAGWTAAHAAAAVG
ncbi:SDR family oxidoreductase [Rhodopseudomonas sp. NSM]|uniref:SDR family oxidoreductase n=1 Tax=Rhodopseudomonas sp. NSM TaxID=3457630 RepID=UPI0040371F1D